MSFLSLRSVEFLSDRGQTFWTSILKSSIPTMPLPPLAFLLMPRVLESFRRPGPMVRAPRLGTLSPPTKSIGFPGMLSRDWSDHGPVTIKFEILCQDGSRNKPVDLHFLTLPVSRRQPDYQPVATSKRIQGGLSQFLQVSGRHSLQ